MTTPEEMGLPNTFDLQRFQDIHLQDQDLLKEYISQYQSGAINTAHQIIETNPQGIGKAFTAKTLNAYTKAIIDLETWTIQNGSETLDELLETFQDNIDNFSFDGTWTLDKEYKQGNFVFAPDGNVYMALKDGAYDITDSTAWLLLGLIGEQGNIGFGLNYRGKYNSTKNYEPLDMVVYENGLYVSRTSNAGIIPGSSPSDWCVALIVEERGIFVSGSEPPEIRTGDYWWEVVGFPSFPSPEPPPQLYSANITAMTRDTQSNKFYPIMVEYVQKLPISILVTLTNNVTGEIRNLTFTKRSGLYDIDLGNINAYTYRIEVSYYSVSTSDFGESSNWDITVPEETQALLGNWGIMTTDSGFQTKLKTGPVWNSNPDDSQKFNCIKNLVFKRENTSLNEIPSIMDNYTMGYNYNLSFETPVQNGAYIVTYLDKISYNDNTLYFHYSKDSISYYTIDTLNTNLTVPSSQFMIENNIVFDSVEFDYDGFYNYIVFTPSYTDKNRVLTDEEKASIFESAPEEIDVFFSSVLSKEEQVGPLTAKKMDNYLYLTPYGTAYLVVPYSIKLEKSLYQTEWLPEITEFSLAQLESNNLHSQTYLWYGLQYVKFGKYAHEETKVNKVYWDVAFFAISLENAQEIYNNLPDDILNGSIKSIYYYDKYASFNRDSVSTTLKQNTDLTSFEYPGEVIVRYEQNISITPSIYYEVNNINYECRKYKCYTKRCGVL